jgi:hypothetical protein
MYAVLEGTSMQIRLSDHLTYVKNKGWTKTRDLSVGDLVSNHHPLEPRSFSKVVGFIDDKGNKVLTEEDYRERRGKKDEALRLLRDLRTEYMMDRHNPALQPTSNIMLGRVEAAISVLEIL